MLNISNDVLRVTRAIYLAVLRADPALRAPATADGGLAGNLRAPLTSFVGRTAELERVAELSRA